MMWREGILASVLVPHEQISPRQGYAVLLGLLPNVHLHPKDSWEGVLLPRGSDGLVVVLQHVHLPRHRHLAW